ncbi:YegP family protein [Microbacterium luteum]|uniref:YegP family protein n=1 Tax=Microbacterium luteum TaxID=2782167 RepID=UPI001E3FB1CA|nr:YegP family protein [Microbacterium luteum]
MTATVEIYTRTDGKYAWRLIASNGSIISNDGGQGYENKSDCERMARYVVNGKYRGAKIKTVNDGRRAKKRQTPPPPPAPPTTEGARIPL